MNSNMNAPTLKLKWKNADAPTGRFRSFQKRGWPMASLAGTDIPLASIECEDSYVPANAKDSTHKPLTVRIANWAPPVDPTQARWRWMKIKGEFATLEAAKAAAQRVLLQHPEFWPNGDER